MALNTAEEAMVRQLLDQQAAILSLASNEPTITSKLGATKVTLSDLVAASSVVDGNILLLRQGTEDKSVAASVVRDYLKATFLELAGGEMTGDLILEGDPTVALQAATKQYVDSTGASAGTVFFTPGNTALPGTLKINGAEVLRADYPNLWTFAQSSGNIEASDAAWVSNRTTNGSNGKFSPGNGTTTFRIPDVRGDFIRAWADGASVDSGRTIGSYQADDFKSHTHTTQITYGIGGEGGSPQSLTQPSAQGTSNKVSLATGGTETRPRNTAWLACIKF